MSSRRTRAFIDKITKLLPRPPVTEADPQHPPPNSYSQYIPNVEADAIKSKEVEHCVELFRKMYQLDVSNWGLEDSVDPNDVSLRISQQRKANALFEEIKRIVQTWRMGPRSRWSDEEYDQIQSIYCTVDKYVK
jgi:hypothetical protein